ncbi:MAG: MarR family transcriptional regulator [Candidatus Sumerlaeota bacterium]|nr:MarR family transcriptional regulator [Candidatus Sumerlaeota bacterium]
MATVLESFGITGAQMGVLKALERAEENGWSQIELSRQIPTSKPNVTGLLKRLEATDLIARESEEVDGRVKRTRLTSKGRDLLQQIREPVEAAVREMAAGLSADEKRTLIILLDRFAPQIRFQGSSDKWQVTDDHRRGLSS